MMIHSGFFLHEIATVIDPNPNQERITCQAHVVRVNQGWLLYW